MIRKYFRLNQNLVAAAPRDRDGEDLCFGFIGFETGGFLLGVAGDCPGGRHGFPATRKGDILVLTLLLKEYLPVCFAGGNVQYRFSSPGSTIGNVVGDFALHGYCGQDFISSCLFYQQAEVDRFRPHFLESSPSKSMRMKDSILLPAHSHSLVLCRRHMTILANLASLRAGSLLVLVIDQRTINVKGLLGMANTAEFRLGMEFRMLGFVYGPIF